MSERIVTERGLDLRRVCALAGRPEPFGVAEPSFWQDPYVSSHVLEAHLDPSNDLASRRPDTIDASVAWICSSHGLEPGMRILDLGCGPGLYTSRFAEIGLRVSGIDFGPASIEYARNLAASSGRDIDYRFEDYRTADLDGPFDAVTLIFGDFCTHSDTDRDLLLSKIGGCLAPGGSFVFDVFTREYVEREQPVSEWYVSLRDGFWSPHPHLVLEQRLDYPEQSLRLNRYLVMDESGSISDYRIWHRYYDRAGIVALLEGAGFEINGVFSDLEGGAYEDGSPWIGISATPV